MGGIKAFDARLFIGRENIMGDRPKITIESMETCGRNLYIGTSDYYIHHFMMNLPSVERETPEYLSASRKIRRQLNVKKSPIQIRAAPALNYLLVNCDGVLIMVNMLDLSTVPNISGKVKNIKKFCVNKNPTTQNPLCVEICISFTRKKILQIVQVHEDKMVSMQEISLSHHVETFGIDHECILMCTQASYSIVYFNSGQRQELFSFGSDSNSQQLHLVEPLGHSEFLISAAGALGVFVSAVDGTSNRPPMQWSEGVFASMLVHPYIIALNSEMITVHSIVDQQQKQSLNFQGGFMLTGCEDGSVLIATAKDIFALVAIPLQEQVKVLLAKQQVDEAIELVKASRRKLSRELYSSMMRRINCMAGFIRFANFEFDECKSHFFEGQLDPRELLSIFPGLLRASSTFQRSVPPLHQIANLTHMCENDEAKIWACQEFLHDYLQLLYSPNSPDSDLVFASTINLANLQAHDQLESLISKTSAQKWLQLLNDDGDDNVIVTSLQQRDCHHSLALLWVKCGRLERALETWRELAHGKVTDSSFPGLAFVARQLSLHSNRLGEAAGGRKIFLENVDWLLRLDENAAVESFMQISMTDNKMGISRDDVIEFLGNYETALVRYLRHLVVDERIQKEKFHTRLVTLYLERVLRSLKKNEQGEKVAELRSELREILKLSSLYRVNLILGKVVEADLYEEQVLLYARLKEHEKSLQILVEKIQDSGAAEQYCVEHGDDRIGLFHILLGIYVRELPQKPSNSSMVIELLNKHAESFDLGKVLQMLPGHWSVGCLMRFLQNGARSPEHELRVKNIELMMLQTRLKQLQQENRNIELAAVTKLDERRTCSVCNRLFTDEQPFMRYPNDVLVHLSCSRDPHICPVTGKIFKLQQLDTKQ